MKPYGDRKPQLSKTVFIAPGAQVLGAVKIGKGSSVWHNAVLRADLAKIDIGEYANIQDGTVVHVDEGAAVSIGDYVTIGHNATIHGCLIGNNAFIGMGAVILSGAKIGKGAQVAAGAVVRQNFNVGDKCLVMGVPAKVVRSLDKNEIKKNKERAKKYSKLCRIYKKKESNYEC